MRVGSFVLMDEKRRSKNKAYGAIVFMPRTGAQQRFDYEKRYKAGYIQYAIQFLNQTRDPVNDPDAVDILIKLWPELRKEIEDFIEAKCLEELGYPQPKENPDEPPPIPF